MRITKREAREFIRQYLSMALWSSHDYRSDPDSPDYDPDAGENMEDSYEPEDATPATLRAAREDVFYFFRQCAEQGIDLRAVHPDMTRHAYDLWITSARHGAGFWDRGYGSVGQALTYIAHSLPSRDCAPVDSHSYTIE